MIHEHAYISDIIYTYNVRAVQYYNAWWRRRRQYVRRPANQKLLRIHINLFSYACIISYTFKRYIRVLCICERVRFSAAAHSPYMTTVFGRSVRHSDCARIVEVRLSIYTVYIHTCARAVHNTYDIYIYISYLVSYGYSARLVPCFFFSFSSEIKHARVRRNYTGV